MPLRHEQRGPERDEDAQLLPQVLGRLGQCLEHLDTFAQMLDGLGVGRALDRPLPGLQPIGQRFTEETSLLVVMGQQLRLLRCHVGKERDQHLGNPLVIKLPCALQQ